MNAVVLAQMTIAGALAWSCFCRLVRVDLDTNREIRWCIVFLAVVAGLVGGAPILPILMPNEITWAPWTTPTWVWLELLLATTLMQMSASKYWRAGVPAPFTGS